MNTNDDTISVTDLRHKTAEVLRKATNEGLVYLMRHSKPEAAIIDINYLRALEEAYEEYLDIQEFDRTIGLKRVSLAEYKKRRPK